MLPASEFFVHHSQWRPGKLFPRCKRCHRLKQGRNPELSGAVPIADVLPMLRVLETRLGRAEMCRRAGLSARSFWYRLDHHLYPNVQMRTYLRIKSLHEAVLSGNEQRDPNDIAWGRKARGHLEGLARSRAYLAFVKDDRARIPTEKWTVRNEPDKTWWIQVGNQWVPRYGHEMLGSEF